ncbi:hypothetical protein V3C99_012578 [Haemonchus contortus]
MKSLNWDEKGIRVDGWFLSNLRFADDIVLFSSSIAEAETMLAELNKAGKKVGLRMRINQTKTQFMKNAWADVGQIKIDGTPIKETSSYVYLGRSMNMDNDMREELVRRQKAAWAAFRPLKEVTNHVPDPVHRANLFDSTVLPALCYGSETWVTSASTSKALNTSHRALERCLLRFNRRTQYRAGLRSSDMRRMSRLRDPVEYMKNAKFRWADHIMRRDDDRWTRRTVEWAPIGFTRSKGRPAARWGICLSIT